MSIGDKLTQSLCLAICSTIPSTSFLLTRPAVSPGAASTRRQILRSVDRCERTLSPATEDIQIGKVPGPSGTTSLTDHNTTTTVMASADSVSAPPTTSKLMALPPELRNRIYSDVFTGTTIGIEMYYQPKGDGTFSVLEARSMIPGILLVSRHAHNEAVGLYYARSAFTTAQRNSGWIALWLNSMPLKYVALVTDVRCDTNAQLQASAQQIVELIEGAILLVDTGTSDLPSAARHLRIDAARRDVEVIRRKLASSGRDHLMQANALKASVQTPDSGVQWMSFPLA
ncbi:hypothetical protein LTR56_012744 [Elasticomyces elasticus]|nr:hypothetical protein LTR56_012744 [Elasticomyces elasticus]KAK5754446.1 hypothetical protein LTS12_015515 [Elasticomyces elasticus]